MHLFVEPFKDSKGNLFYQYQNNIMLRAKGEKRDKQIGIVSTTPKGNKVLLYPVTSRNTSPDLIGVYKEILNRLEDDTYLVIVLKLNNRYYASKYIEIKNNFKESEESNKTMIEELFIDFAYFPEINIDDSEL